jgi:hypothetical protein
VGDLALHGILAGSIYPVIQVTRMEACDCVAERVTGNVRHSPNCHVTSIVTEACGVYSSQRIEIEIMAHAEQFVRGILPSWVANDTPASRPDGAGLLVYYYQASGSMSDRGFQNLVADIIYHWR